MSYQNLSIKEKQITEFHPPYDSGYKISKEDLPFVIDIFLEEEENELRYGVAYLHEKS